MSAYLLILFAMFSRVAVASHHSWLNFTAIGGSLLFFGARRPLRQAILPVLALAGLDYYMTVYVYSYPFAMQDYLITVRFSNELADKPKQFEKGWETFQVAVDFGYPTAHQY